VVSISGKHSLQDVFARPIFSTASSDGGWAKALKPIPRNTAANASVANLPIDGIRICTRGSVMGSISPEDVITLAIPFSSIVRAGIKDRFLWNIFFSASNCR